MMIMRLLFRFQEKLHNFLGFINLKYTSEKNNSKYDVIIGPLENTEANNLVSYFISKGYKENEILIE